MNAREPSRERSELSALLSPRSIVIVGASPDFHKVNGRPLKYLQDKGYGGPIYPVNPKYDEIAGLTCYRTVEAVPAAADLAVVALPAALVAGAVRALGARGIKAAIVFSSGFGETGAEGRNLETELRRAANDAGIRLCGPNCLGLINAFERVTATFGQFAEGDVHPGPVGFVTQSGAFGTAIAALARRRGMGLGYFINTGNEADVDFVEVMGAVLEDPRICVGAGYVEGLRDGRALSRVAADALARGTPLVITKVGRTKAGARAARSHTGALAGTDTVFDGVIRAFGIVRARNEEHMLDMVEVLASCTPPVGRGLGLVTQSGGAGVLMADRAEALGLDVPELTDTTQAALKLVIPGFGATGNPVDITGQFVADPALLRESVQAVLADPRVHVGIVWLQLMDAHADRLAGIFAELKARSAKPFIVSWVAASERALRQMREHGIAVLRGAEPAVDAAAALVRYAEARRNWQADAPARAQLRLPQPALPAASGAIDTITAQRLLADCGVATVASEAARTADEAVAAAARLGYPVVLKIESPDIAHKTEVGGVRVALADATAVREAYAAVMARARALRPQARIAGVVVQPMARGEVELVVGLQNDPAFGVVVMVGLGGVHVEVLRDAVFRQAPVTVAEAGRMLEELRGRALLDGVRGRPAVDRAALTRLVSAVSRFGAALGPRLRECDLNPVLAGPDGACAVDWLLVLG